MSTIVMSLLVACGLTLSAGVAAATLVDFRDPEWVSINGCPAVPVPGQFGHCVLHIPALLNDFSIAWDVGVLDTSSMFSDDSQGIWANRSEAGQDFGTEILTFTFYRPTFLKEVLLTHFFLSHVAPSEARVWVGDQAFVFYTDAVAGSGAAGDKLLTFHLWTDTVAFQAPFSGFAIATMEYSPVPEPGTVVLLASGLAGLWGLHRRRRGSRQR